MGRVLKYGKCGRLKIQQDIHLLQKHLAHTSQPVACVHQATRRCISNPQGDDPSPSNPFTRVSGFQPMKLNAASVLSYAAYDKREGQKNKVCNKFATPFQKRLTIRLRYRDHGGWRTTKELIDGRIGRQAPEDPKHQKAMHDAGQQAQRPGIAMATG